MEMRWEWGGEGMNIALESKCDRYAIVLVPV